MQSMAPRRGLPLVWGCLVLGALGHRYEDEYSPILENMIHFAEVKDGKCVFPFYYKNETFYDCIKFKAKHMWCSVNETYQGYWKYCGKEDFAQCVFPFWYRRMIYWECTEDGHAFGKKWCSLTKNYNRDHVWKYC